MATKIAVDMVEKFGMSDAVGFVAYSNSASNRGGGASAISDAQRKVCVCVCVCVHICVCVWGICKTCIRQ
jgi:hypothetical protein